MTGVVGFQVHVGMGAFAAAAILTLAKVTDEKPAVLAIPWGVIVMVCGVTVLTSLLEKTGGIDLFTTILARFATHRSVTGLIALLTGLISVYSSTSGVVLPALLPSVPGLVAKLGGGNPLAIASSILIGGHLVDVSPLSTVGACALLRRQFRPIAGSCLTRSWRGDYRCRSSGRRDATWLWKMVK